VSEAVNIDIRLSVEFYTHPKTKVLEKRLGADGSRSLIILWLWAAKNRSSGDLSGMTDEMIEAAADWEGVENSLIRNLVDLGLIDGETKHYKLHDWEEHNPWAANDQTRSNKSRLSRLAKTNPVLYKHLVAEGCTEISKEEFERLSNKQEVFNEDEQIVNDSFTTVERPLSDSERVVNDSLSPDTYIQEPYTKDQKIKTFVRSAERTSADDTLENEPEDSDPPAENPSEDGGARVKDSGKGSEYTAEFEEFWQAYPRHVAKKDAYAAWKALKRDKTLDVELVMQAARTYADAMRSLGKEEAYMLHAKTFLHKGRWREWLKPDGVAYIDAVKQWNGENRKRGSPSLPSSGEALERQSQRDRESEEYYRREQERLEREFGGDYHDSDENREAPR
jgi:hypothetical protein